MKNNNTILEIKELDIGYYPGKKIIHSGINIAAIKGELISLVGQNGVGKSTLLRTLAGLQKPLAGNILLNGKDINSYKRNELARLLSFVSTEHIYVNSLNVFDLVALGRFPHTNWLGRLSRNDNYIVNESISMVGLEKHVNFNINEISDGEKQRAMIARTLAQDTDIIVLDEPSAFLDLPNKYEVVNILNTLAKIKKKTVIFSSHDLNIAIQEADKLWLMLSETIMEGAPEDLIINKSIDKLFNIKNIDFDHEKGIFKMIRKRDKPIELTGEGHEYIWTKKALERLGFVIGKNNSDVPVVAISMENGKNIWTLACQGESNKYHNIYDLCMELRSIDKPFYSS